MEESNNPKMVIEAVIEAPKKFGNVELGSITILKYAYLEKIHSPFIDSKQEFSVDNIIPSVFVLASNKSALRKYGNDIDALKFDALEWADENLKLDDVPEIIKEIVSKLTQINKAAPSGESSGDAKKN